MLKIPTLSATTFKNIREIQTFMFDCDGVIWLNNELIDGAKKLINFIKSIGKQAFLITNNSTKSRSQYAEKCRSLGLDVNEDQIICTAYVAANYLRLLDFKGKLFAVGMDGLHKELEASGISHVMSSEIQWDNALPLSLESAEEIILDSDITDVLVGFDPTFDYYHMLLCSSYIVRGGRFFATNDDAWFPCKSKNRLILPGTGALVKSVATSTDKKPIIMGKPYDPMMAVLKSEHRIDSCRSLMVGDRLETDIKFGNHNKITTAVVMTGVTKEGDLNDSLNQDLRPAFKMNSVLDLYNTLTQIYN